MANKAINFVSVMGNAVFGEDSITYEPVAFPISQTSSPTTSGSPELPFAGFEPALIKTNILFKEGVIEFELTTSNRSGRCQIALNQTSTLPVIHVGLNTLGLAYGIIRYENEKWTVLNGEGMLGRIPDKSPIKVKITVKGSEVTLFVNEVKLFSANANIVSAPLAWFLHSDEKIEVKNIRYTSENPKIFVIMQFTPEYNELYSDVIQPTCTSMGLDCIRADEFFTNTLIIEDIVTSIKESSAIIAEITPDNPNVFWEVGYSHAIGKPTILVCDKKREKLPFDLAGQRTLFYDNKIAGKKAIETRLKKHLENIFNK